MRVLVDTNIFLDVLLNRKEWVEPSREVLNRLQSKTGCGWISWHTLSNLYYVGRKMAGEVETRRSLRQILTCFQVCPTEGRHAVYALELPLQDFEDALQVSAGQAAGVDWIITRNEADFQKSPIPILSPEQALGSIF